MNQRVGWKLGIIGVMIMALFYGGFCLVGCASSGGSLDSGAIVDAGLDPAKLQMAGLTYAWMRPESAGKMARACPIVQAFASKEKLLEYLQGELTEEYFSNMTPEQAAITQEFILSLARDVGIDIDFDKYTVQLMDTFDLDRTKTAITAVCNGFKAGLAG